MLLESDADEQLLIHVKFTAAAKLRSIVIAAPNDENAPKHVKLFTNRPTIGFSEAEEEGPVQAFELTEENLAGQPVQLKYALVPLPALQHIALLAPLSFSQYAVHIYSSYNSYCCARRDVAAYVWAHAAPWVYVSRRCLS